MTDDYRARQRALVARIRRDNRVLLREATTAPRREDYAHDPARGLTTVVFPPADLAATVETEIIAPLRAIAPEHYYYPQASLHTTIRNVRLSAWPPTFQPVDIDKVHSRFQLIAPRHEAFEIEFEELLLFPNSISLVGYSDIRLGHLVTALGRGLDEIGLSDDKRYLSDTVFFGNMTLARFTAAPTAALAASVRRLCRRICLRLPVTHLKLITCNASCAPGTLSLLHTYPLTPGKAAAESATLLE
jgi:hypothetical protein